MNTSRNASNRSTRRRIHAAVAGLGIALGLGACGGGSGASQAGATPSAGAATLAAEHALPAGLVALPSFHMAAVVPPPPADIDVGGTNASARQAPLSIALSTAAARIDTKRLTPELLAARLAEGGAPSGADPGQSQRVAADGGASPQSASVYTPAQIRAAYGLPPLPASGASLTAAQAAALGAGQTIYLVDAYDDPNAYSDLNTFSSTFGLPTCTKLVAGPATALPLPPPGSGCQLVIAYSNSAGAANAGAPQYSSGWSPEIALDVQWSHAIAPLARIVLLESASASLSDLMGSVLLANQMGPGVLSMSFGAGEGSWVPSTDAYFTATGMTYLASTGDSGSGVSWPAVSNNVLAVGGTSLAYGGSGARTESAWSGSGGGISAYEALPAYQRGVSIAGGGNLQSRAVADVSFNADPNTGQYVVITAPGGSPSWYIYGGTSISSPQWAGVLALVNANRAANGQALLGDMHAPLYGQIAEVPGNYASALDDITTGADGSCATCRAGTGFDQSTGWGTPNFATLLPLLGGVRNLPPLPPATMPNGMAGVAYATAWAPTDTAHDALSYTVSGAPTGLAVSAGGAVSWSNPVAGTYSFGVTVRNTAGMSASGTQLLTIAPAPAAPTVPGGAFLVKSGTAWSQSLGASVPANSGTVSYALAGAPAGLTVTSGGALAWAKPVAGTYSVTARATNAYGKSGSGLYTLTVIAEAPPVFSGSSTLSGTAGSAFTATLAVSDPNGGRLVLSLGGAPSGLTLSSGGVLSWAQPLAGTYAVKVSAVDNYGYAAAATYTLKIYGKPTVAAAQLAASSGTALAAKVSASDPNGSALAYALSGAPAGLSIGSNGVLAWAKPVKGTYAFTVTATDALGLSGSGLVTLKIS